MKILTTSLPLRQRETIGWIDILRVFAVFLVVMAHCCDAFVGAFDTDKTQFLTGVFTGSLTRPSVPLFVMMTGVLLLPVKTDTGLGAFYKKRIGRIVIPLIFWSIVLPVTFWAYFSTIGINSANTLLNPSDYDGSTLWRRLYTWIFNFNFDTVPLWYLYMLIGLYLIMPVMSAWIENAQKKDVKLMLKIWGVSLLIPYIQLAAPFLGYQGNWDNFGILGVCDWNIYGTFYYVSGFFGYLLTAYYLIRWPLEWSWIKTLSLGIPSILAGYAVTSLGYLWFQKLFPGNYAYLEIVWLFCGINVALMTIPVFIIFQKIAMKGSRFLTWLASLSFGVYLCHFIFVYIFYDIFNIEGLPALVRIIFMTVSVIICSVVVSGLFHAFKYTKRLVA